KCEGGRRMPEDLLQELETTAPVPGGLEQIEDLVLVHVNDVARAVEGMKGSLRAFETIWRRMIFDVANGQTLLIQAARPQLLNALDKRLRLLKLTHALATWLRKLGRPD